MFRADRRGVSEVLGFVLIFSLIVASVGIVFTVGLTGLQDVRDTERINNAERAFDVLAENYNDVMKGTSSRSTQIRLSGADLYLGDPVEFAVDDGNTTVSWSVRPITFSAGEESIHLVDGAVIREHPDGAVMIREPSTVLDTDRAQFRIVDSFEQRGSTRIGGDATVQIRIQRDGRPSVDRYGDGSTDLTLNVSTTTPEAWRTYYEANGAETCTIDENAGGDGRDRLSCTYEDVETYVFVEYVRITVAFE